MLFRFNGILRHRVRAICAAFQAAITEYDYQGKYCPIFPIKVNQVRHVVDVINEAGLPFNMGLEVGSKPELMAVLAIQDNPEALLICNGYKDRRYIELALMAKRVGRRPVIVIEKPSGDRPGAGRGRGARASSPRSGSACAWPARAPAAGSTAAASAPSSASPSRRS